MTTKKDYSVFVRGQKRADVIRVDGVWGCLFFANGNEVKQELYKELLLFFLSELSRVM